MNVASSSASRVAVARPGNSAGSVAVALKCVDLRPEIDSLTGAVTTDPRWAGLSDADEAALETALSLADRWGLAVHAVCAGDDERGPGIEAVLRRALAAGANRVTWVRVPADASSEVVARALGSVIAASGRALVVCGAFSLDRGSGSVPSFLAHHLGSAQALGLISVDAIVAQDGDPSVEGVRRLDGGRRERLRVSFPAVVSVEGNVARLRRASLATTLHAESAAIEVVTGPVAGGSVASSRSAAVRHAYRPRARWLEPPHGSTLQRLLELTDAATPRTPPRLVELGPEAAASEILRQLRAWGELPDPDPDAADGGPDAVPA